MLRRSLCIVVVVAMVMLGCGGGTGAAIERVELLFEGLTEAGQRESALLMWNTGTLSTVGAADAADGFERWCREGALGTVGAYEIAGATVERGSKPAAVIVSGSVDGRRFSVRVIPRQPIQWVEKPAGG